MSEEPLAANNPMPMSNRWHRVDMALAWMESHPAWIIAFIVAICLRIFFLHGIHKPLWHDELFTYYIAQAPTFKEMIQQTQSRDLNPPLYYIATRLIFHFLHPSLLTVRLTSVCAFSLAAGCLYSFVGRRFSPLYGLLAALVLLGSFFQNYAYEARPYALILGFLGVASVGWQRATEEVGVRRSLGMLLLILGGFGLLLSHVLALFAYGAFFAAEFVRLFLRRKPDWLLWLCLMLPLTACLLYLPLVQNHQAGAFPAAFQASFTSLLSSYTDIWVSLAPLLAIAVVVILLAGERATVKTNVSLTKPTSSWLSIPEVALATWLILVPLIVTILFMRSHSAYFPRYGIPAVFGMSILVPAFVAYSTNSSRRGALLAAIVFLFGIIPPSRMISFTQRFQHAPATDFALTGISAMPMQQVEPQLPFVDASGLTFLEMDNRENENFLSRVYYLTDHQSSIQYAHATIFEGFNELRPDFPVRANVMPYPRFISQHRKFLVYGTLDYPEDWLLRKLLADGASLQYLGKFPSSYKDEDLYEVTLSGQHDN